VQKITSEKTSGSKVEV